MTVVENVSRANQRIHAATLATLPAAVAEAAGPAILLYGLAPRQVVQALPQLEEVRA